MSRTSIRERGSEAIGLIIGLGLMAIACNHSYRDPNYDPTRLILLGAGLIAGAWIAPTEPIDKKISQIVNREEKDG